MEQLKSGIGTQVGDSLSQLREGADRLTQGSGEVNRGVEQLTEAAPALAGGIQSAKDGAEARVQGAGQLDEGFGRLVQGSSDLDKVLDGELRETQTTDYFSKHRRSDCAVRELTAR